MRLIIGIAVVIVSVMGGYVAMGGKIAVLLQPFEAVIILGAAMGAFVIGNTGAVLKQALGVFGTLFRGPRYNKAAYVDLEADLTDALNETATQVISTRRPLLLENCDAAQTLAKPASSLICAPIQASAKTIGALQIAEPRYKRAFSAEDLSLLELVALFVGKSLHILQLQNILNSRFTQIALAQEADRTIGSALAANGEDADRVAKILAKSFYREMAKAGFSSNQIIGAASEIISQLSSNLQKHTKRIVRG